MDIEHRQKFTSVEARVDILARKVLARLPQAGIYGGLVEFIVFGLKQAWACLFGGLMIGLLVVTHLFWPDNGPVTRYDFLFAGALGIQFGMLAGRLETWREARVILVFHVVGTIMELFKTQAGSWIYPEEAVFRIGGVPLFSGFMYAAVGSYMARVTRIFDIRLERYPSLPLTALLALAIYINFFTHHFILDFRYLLMAATAVLFWRTTMHYRVHRHWHRMPILLGFVLVTLFIWLAENAGTVTRTWLYPNQLAEWTPVSLAKFGSWFLLMIISVVLVTLIHPPRAPEKSTVLQTA